ncbi:MAG: hypothetical protein JWQ59_861 [Cryobacterium sp.]|nr:hypothetical protein [Cryobacterium sp.]
MSATDTEFNPLTGDAEVVLAKARRYEELGEAIARSVITLKKLSEADEQKSDAIAAVKESAANVARDIGLAQERYSLTAQALLTYGAALGDAQDDAVRAISAIATAEVELSDARTARSAAETAAETPGEEQSANQKAADTADEAYQLRMVELGAAQGLWRAAKELKDAAATTAAGSISDVVNGKVGGQLNDTPWDDISKLKGILQVVCEIAGVLAIFLAWVPILGAVLIGLAILGAVIALVDASVKLSRGEGSLSDVIFAAVGVVLAAFGGKLVAHIAKLANVKSAAKVASIAKGKDGYLNSKGFTKVFGASKSATRQDLRNITGFKAGLKETLKNPFELKMGTGSSFNQRWVNGFKTGQSEFLLNPWKLKSIDAPLDQLTTGAKITLGVLDFRTVGGTLQTAAGAAGVDISFKPESMLKDVANAAEAKITR